MFYVSFLGFGNSTVVGFDVAHPTRMMMYNQAEIRQLEAEDSMTSAQHVDIQVKFIRDYANKRFSKPTYVESRLMKSNLPTKHYRRRGLRNCATSSDYIKLGAVTVGWGVESTTKEEYLSW